MAVRVARADQPTTAPSDPHISALIDQLGNDDPAVRKSAGEQLLAAGDAAKDALAQAGQGDDPQIRANAQELLKELDPSIPDPAPPGVANANRPAFSFRSSINGDTRTTSMINQGRTIEINEGPAGIEMSVTGYLDGKQITKHFKAKDPEQLKSLSPGAYQLWAQAGSGSGQIIVRSANGGVINIRGGAMIIGPNPQQIFQLIPPPAAQPSDELLKLRADLTVELRTNGKITDKQRQAIMDQLARVQTARDDVGSGGDPNKENERYLNECDALRKQLTDAGLPDGGTLLPPPANSRLGVTVSTASTLPNSGVLVVSIIDGSRAQKMGLLADDIILRMNDKPISDVTDLRTIVMANKQLTLLINRNGRNMTLKESASTQPSK